MEALGELEEVLISRYLAPYTQPTRARYQAVLFEWLSWCLAAGVRMLEVDRVMIEQWASSLARRSTRATIGAKLVPVCGFYRWAHEEGLISRDPALYVRRPSRPRRSNLRWLSAQQASHALAASREAGPPMSLLVHFWLLNGLRLAESLTARIEHLERVDGLVTLRLPNRKGGVMDRVSLPDETLVEVARAARGRVRGLLCPRVTPAAIYRWLDALSDTMSLDFRLRPHMCRATFVTLALDAGIPARDIIASAGWVSSQMLAYYDRAHAAIRRNAGRPLAVYLREQA